MYGYVSQARLWLVGDLRIEQPIAAKVPWPHADDTFAPLGYRAGGGHTIVPTYPPGIPMLMAALIAVFGVGAEYWLTPLCSAAVVLVTYAIGARLSSPLVGAAAAVCLVTSPLFLHMTCWLLADLPATAFWMSAIYLSLRGTVAATFGAGTAAAIGILIRPNLVPLTLIPLGISVVLARPPRDGGSARLVAFAVPSVAAAVFIAWLFADLYGSPLRSGYGETGTLYSLGHVAQNCRQYTEWLLGTQGPVFFLFPVSALLAWRRGADFALRASLVVFVTLVFACYAAYVPFDVWWYTRFLLPAFPLVFVLCADAAWHLPANTAHRSSRYLALATMLLLLSGFGLYQSLTRQEIFTIGRDGQKYADVGEHVRAFLPENAVIYAMQHTGNVRLYSGRLTIRWDQLNRNWLDPSIDFMRRAGYEPYILLDDWEIPLFRQRFASQEAVKLIDLQPASQRRTHDTFVWRVTPPHAERVIRKETFAR